MLYSKRSLTLLEFHADQGTGLHAEAGSADEGDDEAGHPGQHHVGSTAQHGQPTKHFQRVQQLVPLQTVT